MLKYTKKIQYGYGNFGNLAKHYEDGRQGFPNEVFTHIWSLIGKNNPKILDVGCGTGIPTRQLSGMGATVVASDKDEEMLKSALKAPRENISYILASAEQLPLENETFDAVTAFSAFHWFANEKACKEIHRVLKTGARFFAINKNDVGDFKNEYRSLMRKFIGKELPEIKKNYEPEFFLENTDFSDVKKQAFRISEKYAIPDLISYFQSISLWNLVPDVKKPEALKEIKDFYSKKSQETGGLIARWLDTVIVSGQKA